MQLFKGVGLLSENKKTGRGGGESTQEFRENGKKIFCVFLLYNTQVLSEVRRAGSEVSHKLSFPQSTLWLSYPNDSRLLRDCRMLLKVEYSQASQDPKFPVA